MSGGIGGGGGASSGVGPGVGSGVGGGAGLGVGVGLGLGLESGHGPEGSGVEGWSQIGSFSWSSCTALAPLSGEILQGRAYYTRIGMESVVGLSRG